MYEQNVSCAAHLLCQLDLVVVLAEVAVVLDAATQAQAGEGPVVGALVGSSAVEKNLSLALLEVAFSVANWNFLMSPLFPLPQKKILAYLNSVQHVCSTTNKATSLAYDLWLCFWLRVGNTGHAW